MQKFEIEITPDSLTRIILTDCEYFEEKAVLVVKPHEHERGFDIFIEHLSERVSVFNDYADR